MIEEFNVESMTCGHCVSIVTKAVRSVDPQAKVEVDLPTHRVRVETAEDREAIAGALAEVGYPPN